MQKTFFQDETGAPKEVAPGAPMPVSCVGDYYQLSTGLYLIKQANFSVATATTDGAVVAAVASKKIKVVGLIISTPTATPCTFTSKPAGAGTAISPVVNVGANNPLNIAINNPLWTTNTAEGLSLTTGAGGTVTGTVYYIEV